MLRLRGCGEKMRKGLGENAGQMYGLVWEKSERFWAVVCDSRFAWPARLMSMAIL